MNLLTTFAVVVSSLGIISIGYAIWTNYSHDQLVRKRRKRKIFNDIKVD